MNEMEELMSMCDAVPLPDPERLARTRAKVADAISKSLAAGHGARRPWHGVASKLRHRWLSLAAPLAAAVKIWGVVVWLVGLAAVVLLWQRPSTQFFTAPRPS